MRAGAKTCAWSVSSSTSSSTSYGVWLLRYTRLHTKLAASSATDGLRSHGHRVAEWVLRGEGAQGFDDDEKGCASSSRSSIKGQLVHVCMYDMPRAADDYLLNFASKYLPRLSTKKVTGPDSLPVLASCLFLGRLLCRVLPTAPSSTCCDGGSWIHFCYFPKNKVPSVV